MKTELLYDRYDTKQMEVEELFYNWLSCDYQYRYLCSLCKRNRFAFTKIIGVEEL